MAAKRSIVLTVCLLVSLLLPACVSKAKYDELELKLEKEATASELAQDDLQQQLNEAQGKIKELSVHKYSTFQSCGRTWRMDTTSGKTCILLTLTEDWKRYETKQQSCACEDASQDWAEALGTARNDKAAEAVEKHWTPILTDACGT